MHQFTIDGSPLNADVIYKASSKQHSLYLSNTVSQKVAKNRAYLDNKMQDPNAVIYGINTGFGSLCNVRISDENLGKLQENLVLSHACGMGERVPEDICRLIHFLKIVNLSHGFSGIRPALISAFKKSIK